MWPEMNYYNEKPHDPITLDLFPSSSPASSTFTLYEDDGVTRNFSSGSFATQTFSMDSNATALSFVAGASVGSYTGKPKGRGYMLQAHMVQGVSDVLLQDMEMVNYPDMDTLNAAASGWCYDTELGGTVHVKTGPIYIGTSFVVVLLYAA